MGGITAAALGKTLSGPSWVAQFPSSTSVNDLSTGFRPKVEAFLAALAKAGAAVRITATLRPQQRAYLMYYCGLVAEGKIDPTAVPAMNGVAIEWTHRDAATGAIDLGASQEAAREMMNGYDIVYPASLYSNHIYGNAIDMIISWSGSLTIGTGAGMQTTIQSEPRSGQNQQLWNVSAGYGVRKLAADPPHWSVDGR